MVHLERLVTDRLVLRPSRPSDAVDLHARRNEPEVARWSSWSLPFPMERAEAMVADTEPIDGWRMLVVTDKSTDETLGDVAVGMSFDDRVAEIGFTFASRHWGNGYATEAASAVIDHLFATTKISRVTGQLHPDNLPSARTLERLGFVFEGHTRLSYWVGDDNSDDWIYGLTRADHEAWRTRPTTAPHDVTLVEITPHNTHAVQRLRTHRTQERMVAPVLQSFADALVPEVVDGAPLAPWSRAVEADGDLVGFVMVAEPTAAHPEPYLWRLLVDRLHQRRGIGDRILDLLVEQCRAWGVASLVTSWVDGVGSPRPFYERRGFVPTGEIIDGEVEARLTLP